MFFILQLICCIGSTFSIAGCVTAFVSWWEKRPIKIEEETPSYIVMDINNGQVYGVR